MTPAGEKITTNAYRTHSCGELTAKNSGEEVRLSGWVHARRDHGGLIFIDLRDRWGVTQLTLDPSKQREAWQAAEGLRSEYVIRIDGVVRERPAEMVNDKMPTGGIEVAVKALEVLSESQQLPFEVAADQTVNEELRLTYRFLDLRHPRMQKILRRRDEFIQAIRRYLHGQGFTEVQTPILANSSPEGARDFLVPSRLHPGKFYALPQAPQQYKQLLMVGGLDKYFQIAPCFRDEDPRADRHAGDFYQIDLEMSFVEQEDIFNVVEPLMIELTEKFSQKKITATPFPRLPWREAIGTYGSDKPDLRYDLPLTDVSDAAGQGAMKKFNDVLNDNGVVMALRVPGGASFTRAQLAQLEELVKTHGAGGLAYIICKDELSSPIIKHLGEDVAAAIVKKVKAAKGDIIFFSAAAWEEAAKLLGIVRVAAAALLQLVDNDKASWVWVTDFPMYEYNAAENKIDFSHNPFSMPQGGLEALNTKDPTEILGYQYDLALNGFEVSSGAIRNHRPDIMYQAFAIAGYSKKDVKQKFGGMLRALSYGAPPHGGFAPGLDRLLFILLDAPSIRDIYAFPKDGKARDLLMNSPAPATSSQLKELHLTLDQDH